MSPREEKTLLTRRRLIQGGAAALLAVPAWQWVRSRQAMSHAKAKVVIVGGGSAGLNIAARLSHALTEPRITVIDPSAVHYYQPGFTMIAGGIFDAGSVVRTQASLIPDGVTWMQDRVTGFDPDRNRLQTKDHGTVSYDFLVLAPGLEMRFDAVEGLSRENLGQGNVHCIYDYQGAQRCWPAIQKLAEAGGRALFTDTWTKVKCGGAPKKINMIAEDYCRRQRKRDRVDFHFYSAGREMFEVPLFRKRLEEIYAERKIPVTWNHRVKSVDPAARKVTFERRTKATVQGEVRESVELITEEFDFLHVAPPMNAPEAVRQSALAVNPASGLAEDWVPTDKATLVHARYKNVCVAGDVAGIPTSKTGAAIRMQAPVVAANMVALMENRAPEASYDGYTACPFVTGYGKVLMAEFNYLKQPAPTFPLLDPGREHEAGWLLKRYVLKPMYFDLMLSGRA